MERLVLSAGPIFFAILNLTINLKKIGEKVKIMWKISVPKITFNNHNSIKLLTIFYAVFHIADVHVPKPEPVEWGYQPHNVQLIGVTGGNAPYHAPLHAYPSLDLAGPRGVGSGPAGGGLYHDGQHGLSGGLGGGLWGSGPGGGVGGSFR